MEIIKVVCGLWRREKYLGPVPISLLSIALLLVITLAGCMGYVPGQQSYWDAQVREMCAKDGGVTIIEHVMVTESQFINMKKVGGYASIPPRSSAASKDILFWDESVTILRDANPKVWRSEQLVKLNNGGGLWLVS